MPVRGDCRLLLPKQRRLRGYTARTVSTMTNGGSISSVPNNCSYVCSTSSNNWNSCCYSNHRTRSTVSLPADRLLLYAERSQELARLFPPEERHVSKWWVALLIVLMFL